MKHKNLMAGVAASLFCAAVLGGCNSSDTSSDAENTAEPSYWETQEGDDELKGVKFLTVAESDNMQLLLNPKTATLRWMDTETGIYQDTNMCQDEYVAKKSDAEQSDVVVSFYSGTNTNLYQSSTNYNSFSMGADRKQVVYQKIDNGVRVIYALGDDAMTYKNFPVRLTNERMQEFVLQHMTDVEIDSFSDSYYTQLNDGTWQRKSSKDQPLGALALKKLVTLFYEQGTYTNEELMADNETYGVDPSEYPGNLMIRFAVDYTLDGDELVVNLDAGKIESAEDSPIRSLTLLPYFLTSSTNPEVVEDEGYMFIPDGSGALIYLDSKKTTELHYIGNFYTGDQLIGADTYSSTNEKLMMPVIGMKSDDTTIMGVIENGAEAAVLDAYISGTDNSEPFSKMKLTFNIREQQQIETDSSGGFKLYKVTDDVYDEMITLRYFWLGEDADYVDMANTYREYLEETSGLAADAAEEKAPLYVELIGVTDKTQYFLGLPYEGTQVMTSFKEAQEILSDMDASGIENIKMIYSGMFNGGMNQRALSKGVSFGPDLGGSSAFKSLVSYAESIGAEIYPNVMLQSAYTKKNLGGEKAAHDIVNELAQIYKMDLVQNKADDSADYPQYLVNPNYMAEYAANAKESYTKKTGLTTMASSDLMTYYTTNYRGNPVGMDSASTIYENVLADMADGMKLMLSNPIASAYAKSAYLTDIPTEDSGMRILDASIPFAQIALDGFKTYSTEALNTQTTVIDVPFMRAIESKSAPKFTFTYRDSALLNGTEQEDLFAIDYSYWKEKLVNYYNEYQAFYETVKDAVIEEHELYEKNEKLRVVTYSNGVEIYFNYSDLDEKINGVSVPAFSYKIVE